MNKIVILTNGFFFFGDYDQWIIFYLFLYKIEFLL